MAWLKADYLFRFGPDCFTAKTQDWLVQAEGELRAAISGESDLCKAAESAGITKAEKRERPRLKKRLTQRT